MGGNGLCWRRKGEKEAPSSMKLFIRISNSYIRRRRRTILQYISSSLHVAVLTIPTTGHYSSSSYSFSSSAYQSNRQCKSCLSTPLFHSSFSMCRPYRSVFVAEKSIHRDHTWHMSYVLHVFCYSVSLPFPSSSVLELNLRKCKCITICCLSLCLVSPKIPSGLHPPTTEGGNYSMHIEHGQTFIWLCMYFALQCDTELTKTINRRNATNNQDRERDAPISSSRWIHTNRPSHC